MSELKCGLCGAELLPATSFCRQCGSAITDANVQSRSEATTALFGNPTESATTQTSTSVVMKKEKVTITLAEEDGMTNILIKQAP